MCKIVQIRSLDHANNASMNRQIMQIVQIRRAVELQLCLHENLSNIYIYIYIMYITPTSPRTPTPSTKRRIQNTTRVMCRYGHLEYFSIDILPYVFMEYVLCGICNFLACVYQSATTQMTLGAVRSFHSFGKQMVLIWYSQTHYYRNHTQISSLICS